MRADALGDRPRGLRGDDTVADQSELIDTVREVMIIGMLAQPSGHPISASAKRGLSTRGGTSGVPSEGGLGFGPASEEGAPSVSVCGPRREGSEPWRARVASDGVPRVGRSWGIFPSFCELP